MPCDLVFQAVDDDGDDWECLFTLATRCLSVWQKATFALSHTDRQMRLQNCKESGRRFEEVNPMCSSVVWHQGERTRMDVSLTFVEDAIETAQCRRKRLLAVWWRRRKERRWGNLSGIYSHPEQPSGIRIRTQINFEEEVKRRRRMRKMPSG
ncbi:hypothetical protein L209DRAFT_558149 [Thermothelomyces heterothallicus CBS 203.75]